MAELIRECCFNGCRRLSLRCLAAVILAFLWLSAVPSASALAPSNRNATAATRTTLDYLATLPFRAEGRLIVGQHVGYTTSYYTTFTDYVPLGYQTFVSSLQLRTGKWLGLIGVDFSTIDPNYRYPLDYSKVTPTLVDHWNRGGLVTVMYSARNPWTWKSANDRSVMAPMSDVVRSGTTANINWLVQLDSVAAGLKVLRDAGVVVLFRPLHEINGGWFWWGYNPNNPSNAADTIALWRFTHDYLTRQHGLDNLLWVYAASTAGVSGVADELQFYPGDDYVDVVGLDIYRPTFAAADINAFAKLRALGKPLCLCEFGPSTQASDGSFDYSAMLASEIKAKVPDIAYMMAWSDYPKGSAKANIALVSNRNAEIMLADPWVLTADEIPSTTHGGLTNPTLAELDRLFDWAETTAGQWFLRGETTTREIAGYTARIYSNGYAIGYRDGRIYALGPAFGGLVDLGDATVWLARMMAGK